MNNNSVEYIKWREEAECQIIALVRLCVEHKKQASKLEDEIHDLEEVMFNASSQGTAWKDHPISGSNE